MFLFVVVCKYLITTIECTVSNIRHPFGDVDGGETTAIRECTVSNTRHAFGEGDGGEAAALIECFVSNIRHSLGEGNYCGIRATIYNNVILHKRTIVFFIK